MVQQANMGRLVFGMALISEMEQRSQPYSSALCLEGRRGAVERLAAVAVCQASTLISP